MDALGHFEEHIRSKLTAELGAMGFTGEVVLERPDHEMADLALPCFQFAKQLRKAPPMIAQELSSRISTDEHIGKVWAEVEAETIRPGPPADEELEGGGETGDGVAAVQVVNDETRLQAPDVLGELQDAIFDDPRVAVAIVAVQSRTRGCVREVTAEGAGHGIRHGQSSQQSRNQDALFAAASTHRCDLAAVVAAIPRLRPAPHTSPRRAPKCGSR